MTTKLIVVDSVHPLARKNRCFDPAAEYTGCGHALHVRLARAARQRGMEVATADVYLAEANPASDVVCVTDMVTPLTNRIIAKGARPAICMSLESPLNAQCFYHHIARYAGRFRHNYQFRGTQDRLAGTGTVFHPIIFPMEARIPLPMQAWDKRDHLVMVNSNKRAIIQNAANLAGLAKTLAVQARFRLWRLTDPWLRVREMYKDRIEAIRYFSDRPDFKLYGLNWDKPIPGFGQAYQSAARKAYVGIIPPSVQSKRQVIGGFRFAICFENCSFPGYITEKIFDCFLAGCIPVYWGAPDVADFVPVETFIDFRRFRNYAELDRFLCAMTESEARGYLDAARKFLASPVFDKFTVDYLVNDMLNILDCQL